MTVQTLNTTELLDLVKQLSPREQIQLAEQILAGLVQQWPHAENGKLIKSPLKSNYSLRGIWAGKGFEKIINLEEEDRAI